MRWKKRGRGGGVSGVVAEDSEGEERTKRWK